MAKRFLITIAFLASITVPGDLLGAERNLHHGENLLQPVPPPGEGWESRGGVVEGDTVMEWRMPDNSQYLMTRIRKGRGGYPAPRFREVSDDQGQKRCSEFDSNTISNDSVNGFQRALWQVRCTRSDQSVDVFLHLYIAGSDSGYYLLHRWSGDPPGGSAIQQWVDYFDSVRVCDTRKRRKAPC